MLTPAERLKKRLATLFKKYTDTHVYTREEWLAKPCHDQANEDALVVVTYEGELYHILNGFVSGTKQGTLFRKIRAMAEPYGLVKETCNHWSLCLIPKEVNNGV